MIDLLFTSTPGPFGAAIRWRTASPWSHVDIHIPNTDLVIGATLLHGVQKRPIGKALRWATVYGSCRFEVPDEDGFWDYVWEHEGEGYGLGEIAGFVLGRAINSPRHICSELVARAALAGGRRFGRTNPSLVTPRDLWDSEITGGNVVRARGTPWGEWGPEEGVA